jgi:hypothetical protein
MSRAKGLVSCGEFGAVKANSTGAAESGEHTSAVKKSAARRAGLREGRSRRVDGNSRKFMGGCILSTPKLEARQGIQSIFGGLPDQRHILRTKDAFYVGCGCVYLFVDCKKNGAVLRSGVGPC